MNEKLIVEREWLENAFDASNCPEQFHGDGFDIAPCNINTDEDVSCLACWIKYGNDKIKPAPASALFAERMEALLQSFRDKFFDKNGNFTWSFDGLDYYEDADNADILLSKIALVKGKECAENEVRRTN